MQKHLTELINETYKLAANIVGQSADAYDVMQDAAAIALTKRDVKDYAHAEFRPWFFKVVRNKAIDKLRANNRDMQRHAPNSHVLANEDDSHDDSFLNNLHDEERCEPDKILSLQQQKQWIDRALTSISPAHREIILLKDYHDFSYAQIAEILDIANGSVMSRLYRARQALKDALLQLATRGEHDE
jgi:RNA polymerase sigma-70 factor (ECF subfamily)